MENPNPYEGVTNYAVTASQAEEIVFSEAEAGVIEGAPTGASGPPSQIVNFDPVVITGRAPRTEQITFNENEAEAITATPRGYDGAILFDEGQVESVTAPVREFTFEEGDVEPIVGFPPPYDGVIIFEESEVEPITIPVREFAFEEGEVEPITGTPRHPSSLYDDTILQERSQAPQSGRAHIGRSWSYDPVLITGRPTPANRKSGNQVRTQPAPYENVVPSRSEPSTLKTPQQTGETPPSPDRSEQIVWTRVQQEVIQILAQSDRWEALFKNLKGKVKILSNEPKMLKGELGRTAKCEGDTEKICIGLAFSRLNNRFEVAAVLGHEYGHAEQVNRRGFTIAEAAPFLSFDQYLILRWWSEFEAIEFEAKVLSEITESNPWLEPSRKKRLENSLVHSLLAVGFDSRARSELVTDEYNLSADKLRPQYLAEHSGERDEKVSSRVERVLNSPEWKSQNKIWQPFIPIQDE